MLVCERFSYQRDGVKTELIRFFDNIQIMTNCGRFFHVCIVIKQVSVLQQSARFCLTLMVPAEHRYPLMLILTNLINCNFRHIFIHQMEIKVILLLLLIMLLLLFMFLLFLLIIILLLLVILLLIIILLIIILIIF